MTRASELRDLTDDELNDRLAERRRELFNLRFQSVTGALENSARLKLAKREIATDPDRRERTRGRKGKGSVLSENEQNDEQIEETPAEPESVEETPAEAEAPVEESEAVEEPAAEEPEASAEPG